MLNVLKDHHQQEGSMGTPFSFDLSGAAAQAEDFGGQILRFIGNNSQLS